MAPPIEAASRRQRIRWRVAAVLLIAGGALALWALTQPWDHFEPRPGLGLPPDPRTFIPLQHLQVPQGWLPALLVAAPPLALLFVGVKALVSPRGLASP
ncbi:MAG: hypothetical protein ACHQ4H_09170 [Ktedonobacterales bacterium]